MRRLQALVALATAAISGCVAAEFRNLSFDEVNRSAPGTYISSAGGRQVGAGLQAELLPGWKLYEDSHLYQPITINIVTDSPMLGDHMPFGSFPIPQDGLAFRVLRVTTNSPVWRLEQTGTVPTGVELLAYRNQVLELQVEINDQVIIPLNRQGGVFWPAKYSPTPTNLLYNISAFAGQEVKLAFVGPFPPNPFIIPATGGTSYIDNIRFVTSPPTLSISRVGRELVLSWPSAALGYVLQEREFSDPSARWWKVLNAPVASGTEQHVTLEMTLPTKVFRLGLE